MCGPTLLKDIWKLPLGKIVDVSFNSRIIARTLELTPLHVDDWRNFDSEEKKKLLNFVRPTQADISLLTHKKRVDGRPLDHDSAKAIYMINEKMINSEGSTDQPPH
ncbi:hypothetical protein H5410_021473 [Solanum commersonii]|uniref:Uncharacterized protein n=1 Tax=Solanum commersonii TaxID=4109 RepID=A0A9J5ZEC9_SOLCO|nr:hypothetical protein H5410_021473 [Solanum commersonii]